MTTEDMVIRYAQALHKKERFRKLIGHTAAKCKEYEEAEYGAFGMMEYRGHPECLDTYEDRYAKVLVSRDPSPRPLCRGCARSRSLNRIYRRLCRAENRRKRQLLTIGLSLVEGGTSAFKGGTRLVEVGDGGYSEGNAQVIPSAPELIPSAPEIYVSAPDMYAALEAAEEYEAHLEDCPYPYGRGCTDCYRLRERVGRLRAVALSKARGEAKNA